MMNKKKAKKKNVEPFPLRNMCYYLNADHSVRPCTLEEYSIQYHDMHINDRKHVAREMVGDYRVSTVWLGMNHGLWGKPLIFETMVFLGNDGSDLYGDRYSTWKEAEEGHKKAVQWVKEGCKDD